MLFAEDQTVLQYFQKSDGAKQFLITSLDQLFKMTIFTSENFSQFKQEVLIYCKDNLLKIGAYIPFPFVKKFILYEVHTGSKFNS